jgi:adenylate cyclase
MSETEKKFRLATLPPSEILGNGVLILQGYVFAGTGELRIRRKGELQYYLTAKSEGTLSREEWETEIPAWVFDLLWPRTEGRRVEKLRYSIRYQRLTFEVDEYLGRLKGLVTLECELAEDEAAMNLILPSWTVQAVDVTEDKRYKNKALATDGLPGSHT